MCEAARENGRGQEVKDALPRPRLLLEAVMLSDGCVQGLQEVGVKVDGHDYNTTHAELIARMKAVEAKYERFTKRGCSIPLLRWLERALMRLDKWREWRSSQPTGGLYGIPKGYDHYNMRPSYESVIL